MAFVVYRVYAGTVSAVLLLQALTMCINGLLVDHVLIGHLRLCELAEVNEEKTVLVQLFLE